MKPNNQLTNNRERFIKELHSWYHKYRRRLPWRESPSLYGTVVSEFMLQQTQVDTVLPYFERWLKQFPDFETLAAAQEEDVVKAWEGLGYYSRARNLHKLAKAYIAAPSPPSTKEEWIKFPGVGPYTAAAITSIALGQPEAVVDGNVVRILARLTAYKDPFKDNTTAFKFFGPLAQELIDTKDPNTHNQAMMELGATICTKANPQCAVCPVNTLCAARQEGIAATLPKFAPRKVTHVTINRLWIIHDGALLLHKTHAKARRLANIYELPTLEGLSILTLPPHPCHDEALAKTDLNLLTSKKRGISNQRIQENIYTFNSEEKKGSPPISVPVSLMKQVKNSPDLSWVPLQDLNKITLSGPHRRWIQELLP